MRQRRNDGRACGREGGGTKTEGEKEERRVGRVWRLGARGPSTYVNKRCTETQNLDTVCAQTKVAPP